MTTEKKVYSVSLNKADFEKAQQIAASEDISASMFIRRLIAETIKKRAGNAQ